MPWWSEIACPARSLSSPQWPTSSCKLDSSQATIFRPDSRSSGQAAPGRGRDPRYRVRVQSNGTLVLSSGYSKRMGLQPGDTFQVEPGRRHLQLRYLGHADELHGRS